MQLIRESLSLDDITDLIGEVDKNFKKGMKSILKVIPYEEKLSEAQRNYYFGVVVATCMKDEKWGGYTKEEVHNQLKIDYLPDYSRLLEEIGNETDLTDMMKRFLSIYHDLTITTETKGSFESFMSRIRAGESRKGIYIPLPNQKQWWEGAELIN